MDRPLFVITGGPGSGKTSLIDALARNGFAVYPEAGRSIIRAQTLIEGPALPERDPLLFAEQMLAWDMRSLTAAVRRHDRAFFDRGIPDSIGFLRLQGIPVPRHFFEAAQHLRYHSRVFAAPPWKAIYRTDSERKQDFAEAVATYEAVIAAYRELGYAIVELPFDAVEERLCFVRGQMAPPASRDRAAFM